MFVYKHLQSEPLDQETQKNIISKQSIKPISVYSMMIGDQLFYVGIISIREKHIYNSSYEKICSLTSDVVFVDQEEWCTVQYKHFLFYARLQYNALMNKIASRIMSSTFKTLWVTQNNDEMTVLKAYLKKLIF